MGCKNAGTGDWLLVMDSVCLGFVGGDAGVFVRLRVDYELAGVLGLKCEISRMLVGRRGFFFSRGKRVIIGSYTDVSEIRNR